MLGMKNHFDISDSIEKREVDIARVACINMITNKYEPQQKVFLAEDPEIECLICGTPSRSETGLLFCTDLLCLWLVSVWNNLQHDLTRMADKADGPEVLAQLQIAFLWGV